MKKILFPLFVALAFGFTFAACSDDDDEGRSFSSTPEIESAGTYTGTFTRVQDGTTDTLTAPGTVTLTATDSAYCTDVAFAAAGFDLDAKSVANISHADDGYVFTNSSTSNGLGAAFQGRIDASGTLTSSFNITQKEGRKTYVYHYSFTGNRHQ